MFSPVSADVDFPALERDILSFWREHHAFDRLVDKNRGKPTWSFIDGPITANGPMGVHHAWGRTYKDLFNRFKAMQGHELRYQQGFDCQGLWVEVEVEKEKGFTSKRDIEAFGIDNFVEACKDRVRRFAAMQTDQSIRLGYWMDWNNSYYTMSDENNYAIWLFLKRCHDRGLIYRGIDSMPWCPRCSTGISHHEIATEGYDDIEHTSMYVKLPLNERPGESLLIWTTTPWTLPANVAAEVHPDLTYVRLRQGEDILILAKGTVASAIVGPYEILGEVTGIELVGLTYRGPFDDLPINLELGVAQAHTIISGEDVTETEGTGIVHIAPGCGDIDFVLGKKYGLPVVAPIDEFARYYPGFGALTGEYAPDVAPTIASTMRAGGFLYRVLPYTHRYPRCWRCQTELVFRVVDEWFISMDGPKADEARARVAGNEQSPLREQIADVVRKIEWHPSWGLERELDWLRNMGDWMISKKRYWGLALPIWTCDDATCGWWDVVGGDDELKARATSGWEEFDGHTPHRPWIDGVHLACGRCGGQATRIPDVGNPWLDAGIVSFSTLGYRHDKEYWRKWFPADFITESFPGQFRNWFYSLLVMSTVLENTEPFRAVLGYAMLRDETGREMHKSWGNAIEFNMAAERIGASVMRWLYAGANPETNLNFGFGVAEQVKRRLLVLWNVYAFFCNYARLDKFVPKAQSIPVTERSDLDRWIISELHVLINDATRRYEDFDSRTVAYRIEAFVDDLSTWYLRRGRARYWKNEADADKQAAYATLWEVLETLVRLLAPSMPFLAETMYQNLVRTTDPDAPVSVHLTDWPVSDPKLIDESLRAAMATTRQVVGLARAARSKAKVKVRQPLPALIVRPRDEAERDAVARLAPQVEEELIVKSVRFATTDEVLVTYRVKPNFRTLGPRFGSKVNAIGRALQALDGAAVEEAQRRGEAVSVVIEGEDITVPPDYYEVEAVDADGYAVVEENGSLVALDVTLTRDLILEGLAREFTHRVNGMRKDAGYNLEDRIALRFDATGDAAHVFDHFGASIGAEVLATSIAPGAESLGDNAYRQVITVDGHTVSVAITRI
jgi:isoleucyl-tRNA synthetase